MALTLEELRELVAKWREFSNTYSGESWMGARKRAKICADELEALLREPELVASSRAERNHPKPSSTATNANNVTAAW